MKDENVKWSHIFVVVAATIVNTLAIFGVEPGSTTSRFKVGFYEIKYGVKTGDLQEIKSGLLRIMPFKEIKIDDAPRLVKSPQPLQQTKESKEKEVLIKSR